MARLGLVWILSIILVQRINAINPIPDLEEEWATFNELLNDVNFRLPTTTVPSEYLVSLTPYFENPLDGVSAFTFMGEVAITVSATESNVQEIVMHCNDLVIETVSVKSVLEDTELFSNDEIIPQCEHVTSFLRIPTIQPLQLDQEYVVTMTFTGRLQTNMRGFYRSWYHDKDGMKWMGTTQFQPGHARQAFPCYDEPSFKAYFIITINREPEFSPTLSNMGIATYSTLPNGRISETFNRTPKTSTYLLAFIVSHYELVATTNNITRPFDIYARNNAENTGDWSLEIGEKLLYAMEKYTQIDFYTMQDNMIMQQAAIPDFSAGAMENWGLLTYREALILFDPKNSNNFYKQRVANIVSHEIAHMWFGNLVTCAWWDNLWLNEGFARFYQYFLTGSVAPYLGYEIRFIIEQVHTAMFSDSEDSAHALTNPSVSDPTSVSNHFSHITYARGASVLRMTQYFLGESTYLKGLRQYLYTRQFNVAEPQHLFDALDDAAEEDNALDVYNGLTISKYFKTWSERAGHPLITVVIDQETGTMKVTQERWERNTGQSSLPSTWYIPVTWTRQKDVDFNNLKPSEVLEGTVTVINRGSSGLEWVIFNKQQTGFYRVNYDDTNWGLLTLALRSEDRQNIHEINRAQIVDDLFAFARAGVHTYTKAFNILSFLKFEDSYAPWMAAISGYNFLRRRLAHDEEHVKKLQDLIIEQSASITARLGYTEWEDNETHFMDNLLRMNVMQFLCNIGHPECVSNAVIMFRDFIDRDVFIPANLRPWVYCTGLREGTASDFDALWTHYINEDLASEKIVLLETLGCTRDANSLRKYLDEIVSGIFTVRPQDYNTALNSATSGNEENTQIVFDWLKENVAKANEILGSVSTLLNSISSRLLREIDIIEFEQWLEDAKDEIGSAYTTGVNGAAEARRNLVWSNARLNEMAEYFENGYQEVELEELPVEPPVTDAPIETTTPDSAHVAKLGIVTFVITLCLTVIHF